MPCDPAGDLTLDSALRKCLPSFDTFDACRKGIMQQLLGQILGWPSHARQAQALESALVKQVRVKVAISWAA